MVGRLSLAQAVAVRIRPVAWLNNPDQMVEAGTIIPNDLNTCDWKEEIIIFVGLLGVEWVI
jgi:hypothetical protein